MSAEDLEKYETEMELKLYREYRDVVGLFKYVIETERRFYLTNDYEMQVHSVQGEVFFEVSMADAWVWDMYRPARFVKQVRVLTFKDVNIEELNKSDLELPGSWTHRGRASSPAPRPSTGPHTVRRTPSQSVTEVVPHEQDPSPRTVREELATRRLTATGMHILARNWRCGRSGEIDIVARDGDTLVICEVKTRRHGAYEHPMAAVTPTKAERLRRLAACWLDRSGTPPPRAASASTSSASSCPARAPPSSPTPRGWPDGIRPYLLRRPRRRRRRRRRGPGRPRTGRRRLHPRRLPTRASARAATASGPPSSTPAPNGPRRSSPSASAPRPSPRAAAASTWPLPPPSSAPP
ncbi:hypothetical protein SALBM135S_07409 [Streptomyces alboniger]